MNAPPPPPPDGHAITLHDLFGLVLGVKEDLAGLKGEMKMAKFLLPLAVTFSVFAGGAILTLVLAALD